MVPVLGLEKFVEIDIQLRRHALIRRGSMFIYSSVSCVFGGDMVMILMLYRGLRGMEGSDRCRKVISLKGFILIGVLDDTIPAHWD
jgi:hypothetical protein